MTDLWDTDRIARECGLNSPDSARQRIKRWTDHGIEFRVVVTNSGKKLYRGDEIIAAIEASPGRGYRWKAKGVDGA